MGTQKTPLQKTYEISTGTDFLNVEFLGSNRQFDWLEISIVPGGGGGGGNIEEQKKHKGVKTY